MERLAGVTVGGSGRSRGFCTPSQRPELDLRTIHVCGVPLAQVQYSDVVTLVNEQLAEPTRVGLMIDAMNTMGVSEACVNPRMREALLGYDIVVPDGMPLVWCMNAKGAGLGDRVYGPYLTDRLLAGLHRHTRVAVIGGFAEAHEWLQSAGALRYPNAEFVLLYDAPPRAVDESYVLDCMERVFSSGAELIFVCLGVPRQYYWTALAKPHLMGRVCVSVGGAFDLISGGKRYAPRWMQRSGLTWLHRVAQEPTRLGPRYLKYNSLFLWLLLRRELFRGAPPHAVVRELPERTTEPV